MNILKNKSKYFITSFFLLLFFVFSGAFVFADVTAKAHIDSAIEASNLGEVLCLGTNFLSEKLMPPIAVLLVLWAGLLYMTAAGRPENVSKARNALTSTIIGIVILLIAPALVALAVSLTGGSLSDGGSDICSKAAATTSITTVLVNLVNWFAWFISVVSVISGLYAGFLYLTSGGNADRSRKATSALMFTLVGVAISILAFSIISIAELFIQ